MDKTYIGKSAAVQGSNFTPTGPASEPDQIKLMAMSMAIDAMRGHLLPNIILAAERIERYLRGFSGESDELLLDSEVHKEKNDLLTRANAFIGPSEVVEFSERNFTAALTLIGDMASYLRGE